MNKNGGVFLTAIIIVVILVSVIFLPYWYKEEQFNDLCDDLNGTMSYKKTCSVGDEFNSTYKYSFICSDFKIFAYSDMDIVEQELPLLYNLNCAYSKIKLK
jgi:hypothetical protein